MGAIKAINVSNKSDLIGRNPNVMILFIGNLQAVNIMVMGFGRDGKGGSGLLALIVLRCFCTMLLSHESS